MALKKMDNVGIVVEDLETTIEFFRELGLELELRSTLSATSASCSPWTTSTRRSPGSASTARSLSAAK
jgi:catechol 2,3-dioxygenase-like lactoylglutathione lyase family enzyme